MLFSSLTLGLIADLIGTSLPPGGRGLFRKRWAIVTDFPWISSREACTCGTVTLLGLAWFQRAQRGPDTCWRRIISRLGLASALGPLLPTVAHIVRSTPCILAFNETTLPTHMIHIAFPQHSREACHHLVQEFAIRAELERRRS